jgi:hypothetical protein
MAATHYARFDLKSMYFAPVSKTKKTGSLQVKIQVSATNELSPKIQMNLPPPQEPCVKFPFGLKGFGEEEKNKKSLNFQTNFEPLQKFWEAFNEHVIDIAFLNREAWFPDMDDVPSREMLKQMYYPIYGVAKKNRDKYEPTVRTKAFDNKENPRLSVKTFRATPDTNEIQAIPCSEIVAGSYGMPNVSPQSIWLKPTQWGVSAIITEVVLFAGADEKNVEEVFSWGNQQPIVSKRPREVPSQPGPPGEEEDDYDGYPTASSSMSSSTFHEPSILLQGSAKRARA